MSDVSEHDSDSDTEVHKKCDDAGRTHFDQTPPAPPIAGKMLICHLL